MRRSGSTVVVAMLAAVLVFVLLAPAGGNDSDPPECFSVFDDVVPCGLGPEQSQGIDFALAGAVLAAALVAVGAFTRPRPRPRDRGRRRAAEPSG